MRVAQTGSLRCFINNLIAKDAASCQFAWFRRRPHHRSNAYRNQARAVRRQACFIDGRITEATQTASLRYRGNDFAKPWKSETAATNEPPFRISTVNRTSRYLAM
jgi:hypothetical protein